MGRCVSTCHSLCKTEVKLCLFFFFFWWGTGTWRLHVCMVVVAVCFKSLSNNQERRGFFSLTHPPTPYPVELRNSVLIMVL